MRLIECMMAMLAGTALATTAFAAGEGGGANSPLNTPTEQDKTDSEALLDLLEADEQQASGDPAGPTNRFEILNFEFPTNDRGPDGRVFPIYAGGTAIPDFGGRIDGNLDAQLVGRARLTVDTSFTGRDELRIRFVQPGQTPPDTTQVQLFGAPPRDDFFIDLPVFTGFEGPDGTQTPKVTTVVRDEVAVGFQVGIDTEIAARRSLNFKDLNVGYDFREIPTEGVEITLEDTPSPQGPESRIGYGIAGFSLGLGELLVQANSAGGPAFPELSELPNPDTFDSFWPDQQSGADLFLEPSTRQFPGLRIDLNFPDRDVSRYELETGNPPRTF